jgi:hypothetical protein
MLKNKLEILALILALATTPATSSAYAADEDSNGISNSTSANDKPSSGFVPIPALYYTPETALAAGGVLIYYSRHKDDSPETKPSQIKPIIIGTSKKQLITSLLISQRWNNGRDHFSFFGRYRRYPDKIWELGTNSQRNTEEDYSCNIQFAEFFWEHAVGLGWMAGPIASIGSYSITKRNESGLLTSDTIVGGKGARTLSLGLQLGQDSRDNLFSPVSGSLISIRMSHYQDIENKPSNYKEAQLEVRKYIPLFENQTMALRFFAQWQNGAVPFRELSSIGGPDRMRGFYEGRYRDKSAMVAEGEYRFPIWDHFRGAIFSSAGNVGTDLDKIFKDSVKTSFGGGLRYVVDPREKISIRIDYGKTRESEGLYVQLNEAF